MPIVLEMREPAEIDGKDLLQEMRSAGQLLPSTSLSVLNTKFKIANGGDFTRTLRLV